MEHLGKVAGVKNNVPTYSAKYVSSLAKAAAGADAANGKLMFAAAGCIACHRVGTANNTGIPFIGPELETIGNTLSTERIIEETLWPGRHVKEGFSLLQVTTKNGNVHQGYEQRSRAKDVILRPLTQAATITIPHGEIREQTELGSAMPAGLTANLSRQQLADLIRYLTEQGRNQTTMLAELRTPDLAVLVIYFVLLVGAGFYFRKRSASVEGFTVANRSLPGWVCGLSIFGTYLSSNTFIGVPGKAYGENWNGFVFSLSLPISAYIAVKWFVPFYRKNAGLSAYEHLEKRFGPWARMYAVACYLLTQISRVGTIMFGVAVGLSALTGWELETIIIVSGIAVTLYTLLGGIEAVIWTDAIQSIILTLGAIFVVVLILTGMPEGAGQALTLASEAEKFSLGDMGLSFASSTVWVMLLYGIFINLTNFGIDQNFVQRYHAADSEKAAGRSVWMGALLYMPVALMFFFIGSILFSYYQAHPALLEDVRFWPRRPSWSQKNHPAWPRALRRQ